jgi:FAD synthase
VLEFVEKIRNIKKFAEPKELSEQIHKDMNWRS